LDKSETRLLVRLVSDRLNVQSESYWPMTWVDVARQDAHWVQPGSLAWRVELQHEPVVAAGSLVGHHDRRLTVPALDDTVWNGACLPFDWRGEDISRKTSTADHRLRERATSVPQSRAMNRASCFC